MGKAAETLLTYITKTYPEIRMTKDQFTRMTTAPIPGLIGSLAAPTIVSMLVTSFYNIADTYFVGKINTQSTAAVGVVFSVMSIIQAVVFFFGHGSGNYISRKLGAQETGNAEKMAATGFFFAIFAGIAIAAGGIFFLTPLSLALGSTTTILPYTEKYNMMLQTIRKPVRATLLSSGRQGLFFIPLIFLLPRFWGLQGVEMC